MRLDGVTTHIDPTDHSSQPPRIVEISELKPRLSCINGLGYYNSHVQQGYEPVFIHRVQNSPVSPKHCSWMVQKSANKVHKPALKGQQTSPTSPQIHTKSTNNVKLSLPPKTPHKSSLLEPTMQYFAVLSGQDGSHGAFAVCVHKGACR